MEFEERYFREELDYLRQLSKLLATEKPHLARFLAEKDADPDIERLLEGVAFLTGNLRQKIEDEFPELTHGLIKMLWPNYLRPVPAMTLIEYTPDTGSFRSISVTPMRFSFLIFVVVRLCLTDCRRNSLPCNCVFRALCPWTSGCAAIPCACIAHLPLIYLSTMQKPSRWTTGGQTIRWFPAAITHNITMYFPLTVW